MLGAIGALAAAGADRDGADGGRLDSPPASPFAAAFAAPARCSISRSPACGRRRLLLSIGIGLMFSLSASSTDWYTSALGAQLTWTLPFGLLIMFAVFDRFNRSYEEAARDLGATPWQRCGT